MTFARPHAAVVFAVAFAAAALAPGAARALPRFAPEGIACGACHAGPPVLDAAGERFLASGFREGGGEALAAHAARALPLSLGIETGWASVRTDTAATVTGARGARVERGMRAARIDLRSAGRAADDVAFDLDLRLDPDSARVTAPVAWVRLDGGRGGRFAARAGRFEAGVPWLADARRASRAEYLAPVALDATGLDAAYASPRWTAAVGRVNSARTGGGASANAPVFDRMGDTYAVLTGDAHGRSAGLRVLFGRQDSGISWHDWLQHLQVQASARLGAGRWRCVPAWIFDRFDDRPSPGVHQHWQWVLFEASADFGAAREWQAYGRLEHGHRTPTGTVPGLDRDAEVLGLARELAPGARAALEWSHGADNAGGPRRLRLDASVRLAY